MIEALKQGEGGERWKTWRKRWACPGTRSTPWKETYGGLDVSRAQEAKQLRDENTKLRKLVADLSLDKEVKRRLLAPEQRLRTTENDALPANSSDTAKIRGDAAGAQTTRPRSSHYTELRGGRASSSRTSGVWPPVTPTV
jgi:putative transposase